MLNQAQSDSVELVNEPVHNHDIKIIFLGISVIRIRMPWDHINYIMGIPTLVKKQPQIETAHQHLDQDNDTSKVTPIKLTAAI